MAQRELTASVILVLLGIGYLIYNSKYPLDSLMNPGPGVFPLFAGGVLIILAGYQLIQAFQKKRSGDGKAVEDKTAGIKRSIPRESLKKTPLVLATIFGLFLLSISGIGFFTSTFLFVTACSKIFGARDWTRPILLALGINLFCYVLFEVWLKLSLPRGVLF